MGSRRRHLAHRRKTAGYSQDDLAARLGVERSTIVRWEAARSEPQPWARPKLAAALDITPDELETLLHDEDSGSDEPNQRVRFELENPLSSDVETISTLRERVRQLDESYSQSPSTTLLGPAGQLHSQVRAARHHASGARMRKAMLEVEAESATLMGQLVWDVSQRHDHSRSVAYLDHAISSSRQAGNPHAEAYAILRKSFIALYGERDPHAGRMLAQQAADTARCCSASLTGLSLLHVAEGYAMAHEAKLSEQLLTRAAEQLDHVTDGDRAAGHYTPNEFNRLAGSCYLFLGLPAIAQTYLDRTITGLAAQQKNQSIALGNLTLALLRQRKPDEAVAALHRTIDTVERTRGGGGINLAFAAGRELRRWRTEPSVKDATDRLFALMTPN